MFSEAEYERRLLRRGVGKMEKTQTRVYLTVLEIVKDLTISMMAVYFGRGICAGLRHLRAGKDRTVAGPHISAKPSLACSRPSILRSIREKELPRCDA